MLHEVAASFHAGLEERVLEDQVLACLANLEDARRGESEEPDFGSDLGREGVECQEEGRVEQLLELDTLLNGELFGNGTVFAVVSVYLPSFLERVLGPGGWHLHLLLSCCVFCHVDVDAEAS